MAQVTLQTTRFGPITVPPERIISMEKPVLGFESSKRFVIVEHSDMFPFVWFQSLDDPDLAFLMVNPALFYPEYTIEVNIKEVEDIEVDDHSSVETYSIVTVADDRSETTINLQGPIVVNVDTQKAKQLVLSQSNYSVREPLMKSGEKLTRVAPGDVSKDAAMKDTVRRVDIPEL
ncbi:MAG: flagellar assembly protein FliW [candidate division Zixibacteria bacterium]|nr:flagellar assembly protein FliW [candidate division Zixibacteria bacterium]